MPNAPTVPARPEKTHGTIAPPYAHTVITELGEMGIADHVLESISVHLSRRMPEHYSHIRIDAKRQALDALDAARRAGAGNGNGNQDDGKEAEIEAVVEVADGPTSPSRHSLLLQGSPPSGKLLIPLNGEMYEWLKEHAWNAKRASHTESR